MDQVVALLTAAAVLGSGIVSGVFFAFSSFVMRALARLAPRDAIQAMQSINITVICPSFMGAFIGTGALSLVALALAVLGWGRPGAPYLAGAAVTYLVGNILVTGLRNVPLNHGLADLNPDDPSASSAWEGYLNRWAAWNHVRALAAILATALYLLALMRVLSGR